MLRFYASRFYEIARILEGICTEIPSDGDGPASPTSRTVFRTLFESLEKSCDLFDLKLSKVHINRIYAELEKEGLVWAEIMTFSEVLQDRISDELGLSLIIMIPGSKADYYEKTNLFGEQVYNKFPSAIFDIEEASKCFALGRNTACVMHLMRVIEIGLRAVANGLGVPRSDLLPTWQAVIAKVESEMKVAANKRSPDWLKIEPFYREIPAHLFAIKNAWRNPSMHVQATYDEERALDIFNAVRGFMRYLATELSE